MPAFGEQENAGVRGAGDEMQVRVWMPGWLVVY